MDSLDMEHEIDKLKYRCTALEDTLIELVRRLRETGFETEEGENLFAGLAPFGLVRDVR